MSRINKWNYNIYIVVVFFRGFIDGVVEVFLRISVGMEVLKG